MTSAEYTAARAKLVAQLSGRQSVTAGDKSVVNRPIKDVQLALAALDAEWQRDSGTSRPRIGRMYVSGEGK